MQKKIGSVSFRKMQHRITNGRLCKATGSRVSDNPESYFVGTGGGGNKEVIIIAARKTPVA